MAPINLILYTTTISSVLSLIVVLLVSFLNHRQKQTSRMMSLQIETLTQQLQHYDREQREHLIKTMNQTQQDINLVLTDTRIMQIKQLAEFKEQLQQSFTQHRMQFDERQLEALKILQDTLNQGTLANRIQVKEALQDYGKEIGKRVEQLSQVTETKLREINQAVEKRLSEGFEKTNATFLDVIKRLALIDAAQQKITELSSNVVSLQEILNDKRSRGAFGEVQLSALISNMIPEQHYAFQYQLSNNRRVDCMLFLPEPTGNIAVDAKFPLENYRSMCDLQLNDNERQQALRLFKLDIRKHIQDIADKYIIPGETSDGAVMFIPAEAVFAEIHAHHSDLVEFAQRSKVWLVSPTTMMAILTTARAVLKDAATRKQVHEIQKHLRFLAEDFERFQMRMDNLAKRIAQAHSDVDQVHISSKKISQRFVQIEKAEVGVLSTEPKSDHNANISPLISGNVT